MKRYLYLILLLVFLAQLLGKPVKAANEPAVSVGHIKTEQLSPAVRVTGHVQSRYRSELSTGIGGVVAWTAEAGTKVQRGDVLARLDTTQLKLAHRRLEVQLQRKQVELERLSQDYQRLQKLEHSQSVSEQALNNARVELALAESDIELLQIEVEQAQDNLTKAHIKAPFSGVITERFVRVGQAISATQSVVKLVNLEQLEVKLFGPLNYGRYLEQKGSAEVYFNSGRTLLPVRALIAVSDERSQTFSAYLEIPAEVRQRFDIGQVVSVSVPSAADTAQFTVPRDALVINHEGRFVYTLGDDNIAKRIAVDVKHGVGDRLAVEGSLTEGQRVIIRGAETLQDGVAVRVLTANEFPLAS